MVGVFMNLLNAVYSVCACCSASRAKTFHQAFLAFLYVAWLLYLGAATWLRYNHAGRVCSGDFLYRPLSKQTRESGILGIEG